MSAAAAAAAAAASSASFCTHRRQPQADQQQYQQQWAVVPPAMSRYESQKRRDWNAFGRYLRDHRPALELGRCSGAHVVEFLRYLDQFGKTPVHSTGCPFYGHPHPPAPCSCPLRQAWGTLDALVGRLRAAFDEHSPAHQHHRYPDANPFAARAVRLFLLDVRDSQAMARGMAYEKKKRKKPTEEDHDYAVTSSDEKNMIIPLSVLN